MTEERVYKDEASMCAAFIDWSATQGWKAYPETAGWDILLVDASQRQIGVQAKMHFNATLLRQAMPDEYHCDVGPDFRAVLLPKISRDVREVLGICGLDSFYPGSSWGRKGDFYPSISDELLTDWSPVQRCKLPEYVPDVAAGASSPIQLTEWKIKALRICAVLEREGVITTKKIKAMGVDPRRWINPGNGWLKRNHMTHGGYVAGPRLRFPEQHPEVYSKIKAELEGSKQ